MNEQQQHDRDHLRASAAKGGQWGAVVLALLDQIDQAEAELDSWMARAYEAEKRAWQAEARIKAVRELHVKEPGVGPAYCIDCEQPLPCDTIRALDG